MDNKLLSWIDQSRDLTSFVGEQLDRSRRRQGKLFDLVGLQPRQTSFRVALAEPGVTLRAYGQARANGPVLLIVAAPLKRGYIWDLTPETSVVQACLRNGLRVYLIQWEQPGQREQDFGLADYADRLILNCLKTIELETGQSQVFLAGHSLGGTLAAIFSSLHPKRVKGLILAGAPVCFGPDAGVFGPLLMRAPKAQFVTAVLGNVPGSVISGAGFVAAPVTFGLARWLDWLNSRSNPQARRTYLLVERWACEEMPLARHLFEEVVELLCRQDRFMRGTLWVGGRRATPELIEAPLLSIVDARCQLVPPQAMLPLHQAVRSADSKLLWYQGDSGVSIQHVGMLVGRQAHQQLWPDVIRWVHAHWLG